MCTSTSPLIRCIHVYVILSFSIFAFCRSSFYCRIHPLFLSESYVFECSSTGHISTGLHKDAWLSGLFWEVSAPYPTSRQIVLRGVLAVLSGVQTLYVIVYIGCNNVTSVERSFIGQMIICSCRPDYNRHITFLLRLL